MKPQPRVVQQKPTQILSPMLSSWRLPLFFARRYLFSRKRVGAINIISGISVAGVAFGTAALLCTLSVFNGFRDLIGSLYTTFDPQIEVVPTQGKFATADDPALAKMRALPEVEAFSFCLEDNALILFRGRPTVIMLKGVDDNFDRVTGIRSILYGTGSYQLHRAGINYAIPGIGLASTMGGIDFGTLQICAPRKGERVNLANPGESFNADDVTSPKVCFDVKQRRYDENYLITSLAFAQGLFEQPGCITGLELKLRPTADTERVKARMQQIAGQRFKVLNQLEQQQEVFNVMNIEKMMAYLFLTFILLVACFNIIGSVSMLIIDKRGDVQTLRNLGASDKLIFRIFLYEGRFIAVVGAIIGTLIGLGLCWLQQMFGFIKLGGSAGNFIIDAYPVSIHATDIALVFATVIVVGFVAVWYPVKYLSKRFLND